MNETISAEELRRRLESEEKITLLDVLPEEEFNVAHLPGAVNAAVYEMVFPQKCAEVLPNKLAPVVVYGSSERSKDSKVAAQKLAKAGYSQVHDFRGGRETWALTGGMFEAGPGGKAFDKPADGDYALDTRASLVRWEGRNFNSAHNGALQLKQGGGAWEFGKFKSARCVIDMTSMENEDINDAETRQMLIQHLTSDDFFETERFPEAVFEALAIAPVTGGLDDAPNAFVAGDFIIRDVRQTQGFPARIEDAGDGEWIVSARFEINRTRWGVIYGSHAFFEKLAKHFVSDLILLDLHLRFRKD